MTAAQPALIKTEPKMTAGELLARLERHYIRPGEPLPGGMFLPEVTHGTAGGRRCDALYVGFTSSRGHHLVGHEVKVSRADWRHELDQVDKAETWASQCHAWYVVAPSEEIVPRAELPHGWGLMVPNSRSKVRMDVLVKAVLQAEREPSWITAHSILKRIDTLRAQRDQKARQEADAAAGRDIERRVENEVRRRTTNAEQVDELRLRLRQIQQALGMDLTDGDYSFSRGITLAELRNGAARYLQADRDVQRAAKNLAGRYSNPIAATKRELDALAKTLESIKELAR